MRRALVGTTVLALFVVGSLTLGVTATAGPFADAGLDQTVDRGTNVYLDAGGSVAPDGSISSYEWTIERPDGTEMEPACRDCVTTSFVPSQIGQYEVTVRVRGESGETATDTMYVEVREPEGPEVSLSGPATLDVDQTGTFTVTASGEDPDLVSWYVDEQFQRYDGISDGSDRFERAFTTPAEYLIEAVVVDQMGREARAEHAVTVVADGDGSESNRTSGEDASTGTDSGGGTSGSGLNVEFNVYDRADEKVLIDLGTIDSQFVSVQVDGARIDLTEYLGKEAYIAQEDKTNSAHRGGLDAAKVLQKEGYDFTEKEIAQQVVAQRQASNDDTINNLQTSEMEDRNDDDARQNSDTKINEGDQTVSTNSNTKLYQWTEPIYETETYTYETREPYTYTETVQRTKTYTYTERIPREVTRTRTTTETYTTVERKVGTYEIPVYEDVCVDHYTDVLGNTMCINTERQQVGTKTKVYTYTEPVEKTRTVIETYTAYEWETIEQTGTYTTTEEVEQTGYRIVEKTGTRQVQVGTETKTGNACPSGKTCTTV